MCPFIIFCFNLAPRYISGGAIFPFLYLTVFPSIPFSISVGFIDMTKISSTYTSTYSYYYSPSGLIAGLNHTSGSDGIYLNPIFSSFLAMKDLKAALADFNPYRALITINTFPCSAPNSGPALIQWFSRLSADKKAFYASAPIILRSFKAETNSRIIIESLDTTVL